MKIISPLLTLLLVGVCTQANANDIPDYKKHLGVSYAIGATSNFMFEDTRNSLALCLGVGIAKEIYDEIDYGGFSGKDVFYDAVGCGLGILTTEAFKFHISEKEVGVSFEYKFN